MLFCSYSRAWCGMPVPMVVDEWRYIWTDGNGQESVPAAMWPVDALSRGCWSLGGQEGRDVLQGSTTAQQCSGYHPSFARSL